MTRIRVAQVTDTHLMQDREAQLRGVPTWHTLKAVLAEVKGTDPDLLLLTGDLADLGEPEAYGHLMDLVAPLQIPTYWIPGNHDDPAIMPELFVDPEGWVRPDKSLGVGNWRLILLDSVVAGASHGQLSTQGLQELEAALAVDPERPTLVALHHNPVPIGSPIMDGMGLHNAETFFELIDRSPQVRLILFGHIHWEFHLQRGSVDIYGTPSSCKQLSPTGEFQSLEQQLPGFRLLDLDPQGTHYTQIRRAQLPVAPKSQALA